MIELTDAVLAILAFGGTIWAAYGHNYKLMCWFMGAFVAFGILANIPAIQALAHG